MDDNINTVWHCSSYTPCVLRFDLGVASRVVHGIALLTMGERVTSGLLQYNQDGGTIWYVALQTSELVLPSPSPTSMSQFLFANPIAARFWRLEVYHLSSASGYPALKELAFLLEWSTCVKVWDGNNFDGGWKREFGVGNYLYTDNFPNDGISSLKVMSGCHADIWDDGLFAQTSWHVSLPPGDYDNTAFLAQGAADNAASSLKVSSSGRSIDAVNNCGTIFVATASSTNVRCQAKPTYGYFFEKSNGDPFSVEAVPPDTAAAETDANMQSDDGTNHGQWTTYGPSF